MAFPPGVLPTNRTDGTAALTNHKDDHNNANAAVNDIVTEIQASDWKNSVRVATTANGTLATAFANGQTIDGVVLATGNRILLKNQSAGAENGIYTVNAAGAPTRAADADTSAKVTSGMTVHVEEGSVNFDATWQLATNNPITLGTTALYFRRADMMYGPWTPLFEGSIALGTAASGTYVATFAATLNATAANAGYNIVTQYVDAGDYALGGRGTEFRVVANHQHNALANAGTSVATAGLYPVVPAGGTTTWVPTLGTVVAGSTAAQTGGAAASDNKVLSSTFSTLAADSYTFGVVISVATTAGGTKINCRLEHRIYT